jgi:hypothetical protein
MASLGVVELSPWPRGWPGHPQKAKKKKKKVSGFCGWPNHLQGPGVALATPIRVVVGGCP